MELYILKSSACLLILFSFYKLFLEKENMHTFKRFYLLGSLIAAMIIPWVTFTTYVEVPETFSKAFFIENTGIIASETETTTNYLPIILWTLYGIGVAFFSFRFFRNLQNIIIKIRRNPKHKMNRITNVLLSNEVTPHTFFNYIFLNRQHFEANEIPSEVLIHEQTHAFQKHSIDVIFIELIQIVLWFNPLVYLLKYAVKLNHEFLADQAVINNGIAPTNYQNLLLAFSSNATPQLANSINYSSTKKRFTVMKTETSKRRALFRSLVLLPLVAILVFGFSSTEVIQKEVTTVLSETSPEKANSDEIQAYNKMASFWNERFAKPNAKRTMPLSELEKLESTYRKMTVVQRANAAPFPACAPLDNATPDQIVEFNKLAKKYNSMNKNNMFVKKKDVERLQYIYNLMTLEQRENAEPFPNFPSPPKAPKMMKDINDTANNIPPPPPPPSTPEVTKYDINVYNHLAEKYKFASRTNIFVKKKDIAKLNQIYKRMTQEQRRYAEPFPNFPPPPLGALPPPDPASYVMEMAKKGATFYLGTEEISADKAVELVRKNNFFQFDVLNENSENPIILLNGC